MWMGLRKFFWPDVTPSFDIHSEFDPNYGFSEPRQKKVMKASVLEMDSVYMDPKHRDFCAHHYLKVLGCVKRNAFQRKLCYDLEEEYKACLYHEVMDRHKDFERERRLLVRRKRIQEKQAALKKKMQSEKATA